jgi:septum formation protein
MSSKHQIILASSSPRRQQLLGGLGFEFIIEKPDVEESFPPELPLDQVARYIAEKKAESFRLLIQEQIVITADTVVILDNRILNKPSDRVEAIEMLESLSARSHKVMTGVCLISKEMETSLEETSVVAFRKLNRKEIESYVDQFNPFDKAGAYGAQDCLQPGINPCSAEENAFLKSISKVDLIDTTITVPEKNSMVAIDRIEGSYFNVMGFPIHRVYPILQKYLGA